MTNIIKKTIQAISWNFKSQILTQGVNFLVGILLMRLVVPDDFGKFAMVLVVFSFLQILRDAGLSAAIIQKADPTENDLSTAFWFQLLLAALFSILLFFSGDWFNALYGEEELDQISIWFSIDFFFGAIGLIPTALLKKELLFKNLFRIQFLAVGVSSILGIVLALSDFGYFSLVGKFVSWTILSSLGGFLLVKWKPKFQFSSRELIRLLKFGVPVTSNHVLSFFVRNTDDFFIGRVIGSSSLGLYNRAYALMLLPMANITSVLQNVLFPSWSKMQDDPITIKKMYIRISGMIAFFSFPIMFFLALFADLIIENIFGASWLPMTNTLRILSLIGMFQSVSSLAGLVFLVFDRTKLLFKINSISGLLIIGSTIWAVYMFKSIELTAFVYSLASFFMLGPVFYFAGNILKASVKELIAPMIYPLLISLIAIFPCYLFFQIPLIDSDLLKLMLSFVLFSLLYIWLSNLFKVEAIRDYKKAMTYYNIDKNE